MSNSSVPKSVGKADWVLTQSAFHRFLDWLDGGAPSSGHRYLGIRDRLVVYFDRKNCLFPEELADETLNRVTRRLEEEGAIESDSPLHYCYIIARFVFLNSLRSQQRQQHWNDQAPAMPDSSEEKQEQERRSDCLARCMLNLETEDRELIIDYYRGERRAKIESRKAMAEKLEVTMNTLSIRACRIRGKLGRCMRSCLRSGNERS